MPAPIMHMIICINKGVMMQAVALRCARLPVSDPRAERDAIIAATALVHGMTIVTRNTAHFEASGAPVINPWE